MGVPAGTPMSIPGCDEQSPLPRQREPNGLVIGPFTGQMNPDADDSPFPVDPLGADGVAAVRAAAARSAAWIFAASAALSDCSALASATNSCSFTWIDDKVSRFVARAVASCCCD